MRNTFPKKLTALALSAMLLLGSNAVPLAAALGPGVADPDAPVPGMATAESAPAPAPTASPAPTAEPTMPPSTAAPQPTPTPETAAPAATYAPAATPAPGTTPAPTAAPEPPPDAILTPAETTADEPAGRAALRSLYEEVQGLTAGEDYLEHVGLVAVYSEAEAQAAAAQYGAELVSYIYGMGVLRFPESYLDKLAWALAAPTELPTLYPDRCYKMEETPITPAPEEPAAQEPEGAASEDAYSMGEQAAPLDTAGQAAKVYVNDPKLKDQWYIDYLDLPLLWTRSMGEGVTVAVLDSGADMDHPDLKNKIVAAYDCFGGNDGKTYVDDPHGHGTMVTGLVAAESNNGVGIAGVAPKADLIICRAANGGDIFRDDTIYTAIYKAVDAGADVISLSTAFGQNSNWFRDSVAYAVAHGTVICAAAGNYNTDTPRYPASMDDVIGVGSIDNHGQRLPASDFGPNANIMAPGSSMLSTARGGGYGYGGETSAATPVVAGMVALLMGANPELITRNDSTVITEVQQLLYDSAIPGPDEEHYGHGIVDLHKALGLEGVELFDYSITYELNGGQNNPANPAFYNAGRTVTLKAPTREHCTFGGWYTDAALTKRVTSVSGKSVTLYAKWTAEQFKITYTLNGGKNSAANPKTYSYGTPLTLAAPTRSGYAFAGWYTDAALTQPAAAPQIAADRTGAVQFYAKWQKMSLKLTGKKASRDTLTLAGSTEAYAIDYQLTNYSGALKTNVIKADAASGTLTAAITQPVGGKGTLTLTTSALNGLPPAEYTVQILGSSGSDVLLYELVVTVSDLYETRLKLKQTVKTMYTGQSVELAATPVWTARTTQRSVTWSTDTPELIDVDETTGAITALAPGKAVLRATAAAPANMTAATATAKLTVKMGIENIAFTGSDTWYFTPGKVSSFKLETALNADGTKPASAKLTYEKTAGPDWVTVNRTKGTVSIPKTAALPGGEAVLTVRITAADYAGSTVGTTASVTLKSLTAAPPAPPAAMWLEGGGAHLADYVQGEIPVLNVKKANGTMLVVARDEAGTQRIAANHLQFSSSNKKVLTVGTDGTVTAVGAGKAKITAKCRDGSGASLAWTVKLEYAKAEAIQVLLDGQDLGGAAQFSKDSANGNSLSNVQIQVREDGAFKNPAEAENAYNLALSVSGATLVQKPDAAGLAVVDFRKNSTAKSMARLTAQEKTGRLTCKVPVYVTGNGTGRQPTLLSKNNSDHVLYSGLTVPTQTFTLRYRNAANGPLYRGIFLTADAAAYAKASDAVKATYDAILGSTGRGYRAAQYEAVSREGSVTVTTKSGSGTLAAGKYKLNVHYSTDAAGGTVSTAKAITVTVKALPTLKLKKTTHTLSAIGQCTSPLEFTAGAGNVAVASVALKNINVNGRTNRFTDNFGVHKNTETGAWELYIRTGEPIPANSPDLKGDLLAYAEGSSTPYTVRITAKVTAADKDFAFAKEEYTVVPTGSKDSFVLDVSAVYKKTEARAIHEMKFISADSRMGQFTASGHTLTGTNMCMGPYTLQMSVLPEGTAYDYLLAIGDAAGINKESFMVTMPLKLQVIDPSDCSKILRQKGKAIVTDSANGTVDVEIEFLTDSRFEVRDGERDWNFTSNLLGTIYDTDYFRDSDPYADTPALHVPKDEAGKTVLLGSGGTFSVTIKPNIFLLPEWEKGRKLRSQLWFNVVGEGADDYVNVTVPIELELGDVDPLYAKYRNARVEICSQSDPNTPLVPADPDADTPLKTYKFPQSGTFTARLLDKNGNPCPGIDIEFRWRSGSQPNYSTYKGNPATFGTDGADGAICGIISDGSKYNGRVLVLASLNKYA